MTITRVKGRLSGQQPGLSMLQLQHLMSLHEKSEHSPTELTERFGVDRSMVYRTFQRESAKHTG